MGTALSGGPLKPADHDIGNDLDDEATIILSERQGNTEIDRLFEDTERRR